jgi:hypothetical protein
MAKFKKNNVELRDNQKLIFDSAKNKYMSYDGVETYINTTLSGVEPTEDYHLTTKVYVDSAASSSVFGSEFQESSSEGESSTTSQSFQQKLRLTTGNLPSGKYRIGWYVETQTYDSSKTAHIRIQIDDTTTIGEDITEPDSSVNYWSVNGFRYEILSGVTDTDLDYRCYESSSTTYIRRARLEIWRVS